MPQYRLDISLDRDRFQVLDDFTQGYVEAAFWLIDEEEKDKTFADLSDDALQAMVDDCDSFRALPEVALALEQVADRESANRAGVDFWLTRNHHGAGFWDRGLGEPGDVLTKWSHTFGETDLYAGDDGKLYV